MSRLWGWLLVGVLVYPVSARSLSRPEQLKVIEIREPGGQILSYRRGSDSADVELRGTRLAPGARIRLKVGSRPGFVELDINRGAISGLKPADHLGRDLLTYVLWAVSVDGRAANLGEITFDGSTPISVNVTTPYQTFWLMVTAEPDYAVVEPSPHVVLYSVGQNPGAPEAVVVRQPLFYYTHYTRYDLAPGEGEPGPNELRQARKSVELVSRTGLLTAGAPDATAMIEERQAHAALALAKGFLRQAEDAYRKNPAGHDVVQFSRTAAQIAENARALTVGAVGGALIGRLERDLGAAQAELAALRAERTTSAGSSVATVPKAVTTPAPVDEEAGRGVADTLLGLAAQPIAWFGVIGWGLVVLLLFRRRTR